MFSRSFPSLSRTSPPLTDLLQAVTRCQEDEATCEIPGCATVRYQVVPAETPALDRDQGQLVGGQGVDEGGAQPSAATRDEGCHYLVCIEGALS